MHILELDNWKPEGNILYQINMLMKLRKVNEHEETTGQKGVVYPKVPMTWVEMCLFPSSSAVRANPKSETLGVKSYSNKMLLALKSR